MKNTATTILLAILALSAHAQNTQPDLKRELTLDKEYTPTLEDANKINTLPEIKAPAVTRTPVTFSNYTLDYNQPFQPSNFGIVNYFPEFATSNKRGYLHAGIATNLNIDGDLGYQILHSATNKLSIFASHRSSDSDVKYLQADEKGKMKINDNLLATNYVHSFEKVKLFADAQYLYSNFNYYRYLPPSYASDLPNQTNNLFQIHAGIESFNNKEIDYKANLTYSYFKPKYGGENENRLLADFDLLGRFFGLKAAIKSYAYSKNNDLTASTEKNFQTLSGIPYLKWEGENWDAQLGVGVHLQVGDVKEFIVSPDVKLQWRPTEKYLVYLNATGGIQDNSKYTVFYENRYISSAERIRDSRSPFDGTFGINFTPVNHLNIDLFAGYKWVRDEHFYDAVNTPWDADATVFKWGGAINYSCPAFFDVGVKLVYNHWNITESGWMQNAADGDKLYAEAWNKPEFMGDFNVKYRLQNIPVYVDLTYHLETGRKYSDFDFENLKSSSNMRDIHALNLQGTYEINNSFSVFAKANNLLFQKYDLWYGYPAQSFNIMVGINWKF